MTLNREWHRDHPMPAKATPEQKHAWHLEHALACGCRKPSDEIRRELERLGKRPPRTDATPS